MRRVILLMSIFVLVFCTSGTAQTVIFQDDFGSSGPKAEWGAGTYAPAFGANGTFETVTSDTNWLSTAINPPAGNTDGYFGKLSYDAPGYATAWRIVDAATAADYTIEAKIYTEIVNTAAEPDDYHYCQIVFYESAGGYSRYHTHLNADTTVNPSGPRIRVQCYYGGWTSPLIAYSPTTFTASEGWHDFKIEINSQIATCYYDSSSIGTADFSSVTTATGGSFGIGQYIDGVCSGAARSVYVDDFVVTTLSSIADWQLYE